MRISTKATSAGLILAGLIAGASAQGELTTTTTTTTTAAAASGLVAPRTGVYPGAINAAADNTVNDYTKRGTLIDGKQYFAAAGNADLLDAAYSFNAANFDWFGSVVANSASLGDTNGTWRQGIATRTWAAGILVNFDMRSASSPDHDINVDGNGFGLFGDFNLGGSDVYGEAAYLTGPGNYDKNLTTTITDPSTIRIMAGWKKDATTEGTHSLNLEGNVDIISTESGTPKVKTDGLDLSLMFSHGYILKAGTGYAVFLGSNTGFQYLSVDEPSPADDPSEMQFSVAPNLVFHKDLGHNFELSSGASATLAFTKYSNIDVPGVTTATPPEDGHVLLTTRADVNLGLRWVKDNFAFEGSLNQSLLQSGPNFISGDANPMFAMIGVSLAI